MARAVPELQHHGGGGGGLGGGSGGGMSRATPPGARDRAMTARSNLAASETGRSSSSAGSIHRSSPSSSAGSSLNHQHPAHLSHPHHQQQHHHQHHHQPHHGHAHHLPHHNPLSHLVGSGGASGALSITKLGSPGSAHDLRISNSPDESPLASPIGLAMEPAVNLALGAGGTQPGPEDVRLHVPPPYGSKPPSRGGGAPSTGYTSNSSPPRPEHLFQDQDIAALVATTRAACPPSRVPDYKDTAVRPTASIKVEPLTECRGD